MDEARYLLREELREVTRYFSILEAIAWGATGYGEIASRSGVLSESLSKYLRILEEMGVAVRELPVVGRGRARYRVADSFMRFWFRYVPRYRAAIELGASKRVVEVVRRDFEERLLPLVWEEVVANMVVRTAARGDIPVTVTRMGRWRHRG